MYIAESNVFYCILCLCIVTVVLLLYLAIWATISLNTLHFNFSGHRERTTARFCTAHTLWGKKLHLFYFLNNSVKPRSMSIIFGTHIPERVFHFQHISNYNRLKHREPA